MAKKLNVPSEVSLMVEKYLVETGEVPMCMFMFAVTVCELEQKSCLDKARRLATRLRNYAKSQHFVINATKLQKMDVEKMLQSLNDQYGV